ncbi:hypothetical protein ABLN97_01895 [Mycobacterium tuberculosis]
MIGIGFFRYDRRRGGGRATLKAIFPLWRPPTSRRRQPPWLTPGSSFLAPARPDLQAQRWLGAVDQSVLAGAADHPSTADETGRFNEAAATMLRGELIETAAQPAPLGWCWQESGRVRLGYRYTFKSTSSDLIAISINHYVQ